ncbi:cell division ATP-binding protein FtsE [Helcobacillus massiliensis]|uniref:cell division ATP-binding protein FtsE n=1 Tax=Helcobacillus TaxID=1161125 RepID=UPI001EF63517|nr:cell division ATP-binding protein FtsE [Helcobacillus massiliensis]MCG7426904.1 cell division ATP-binding protein FtsE [Helcobacillus sp. ACRRO]MCT1557434.1 cell division ATP-binding protein FtsE [Helcobacillus massiliensis]MCT2036385.1 cell division ATP-binding protein FtsE [Helcobacillus massiliensis]MCT2331873.1 cell division ATP-binding protein FtsE [Helcobacillus massiliensis]
MIRFDDVTKAYQRTAEPALDRLTIEFERGEFAFLVGASGSGKSTMMRLILKETTPSSGSIFVAGKDLSRIPSWKVPKLRRDIGMVFQDFRLLPTKTAYQNIEFALHVIGTPRSASRRLVPEMLEMVGLEDKGHRMPHELSGGEQQRVAIARAYVNRPRILLADEPTGNLDPQTAEGIMELLTEINDNGTTVLMATHDRSAVDRMKRRVVELVGGVVVRDEVGGGYTSSMPLNELGEPVGTQADRDRAATAAAREAAAREALGRDADQDTPTGSMSEPARTAGSGAAEEADGSRPVTQTRADESGHPDDPLLTRDEDDAPVGPDLRDGGPTGSTAAPAPDLEDYFPEEEKIGDVDTAFDDDGYGEAGFDEPVHSSEEGAR